MSETSPADLKAKSAPAKFGTFGGVFTPSTLTILGVIMFLRFGQVVGQSGILDALIIVACAKLITTLTALSISAVVVETDLLEGAKSLLQCHGLGGFKPNTVILGWSDEPDASSSYGRLLRLIKDLGRSLVIARCKQEDRLRWTSPVGTIDIWWRGGWQQRLDAPAGPPPGAKRRMAAEYHPHPACRR